jgi:predicted Ser/Thr protein kinase
VTEPTPAEPQPSARPSDRTVSVPPDLEATRTAGESGAAPPGPPPAVPGYDIVAELGRGGMGVVYKARQAGLDRAVALKMILAGARAGPAERSRFRTEAAAIARLRHPNIVQVYHVGECDGNLFFAMELVEGGSLADAGPWEPGRAAAVVEKLARAVHAVHAEGIVHRDLKPGNVLVGPDGEPRIVDFGLAKLVGAGTDATVTGAVLGTPGYMAPEQAEGRTRDVGPHTDVYALGAVLYHLLTGRPPFQADSPLATIRQIVSDDPVPPRERRPDVPADLDAVCLKCLAKEPRDRYPSAAAVADDLKRVVDGEPVSARPLGLRRRLAKWWQAHPGAGIALVVAAGLWSVWFAMFAFLGNFLEAPLFAVILIAFVRPTWRTLAGCAAVAVVLTGLRYLLVPDVILLAINLLPAIVPAVVIGAVGRAVAWVMKRDVLATTLGAYFGTALGSICACCGVFPIMGMALGEENLKQMQQIQARAGTDPKAEAQMRELFGRIDYTQPLLLGIVWVVGATGVPATLGAVIGGAAGGRADRPRPASG